MNPTTTRTLKGYPVSKTKPFRKPGTVVPFKPAAPANGSHILGAAGAMRRSAPPRMPPPEWPSTQPPAMQATARRVSVGSMAERVAERDAHNTQAIAERMERERSRQALLGHAADAKAARLARLGWWLYVALIVACATWLAMGGWDQITAAVRRAF